MSLESVVCKTGANGDCSLCGGNIRVTPSSKTLYYAECSVRSRTKAGNTAATAQVNVPGHSEKEGFACARGHHSLSA